MSVKIGGEKCQRVLFRHERSATNFGAMKRETKRVVRFMDSADAAQTLAGSLFALCGLAA
jgi:hypothetical protein